MNANVKGMLDYYRHPSMRRKLDGIIQTENGYHLTANEAWAFLCWCDANGYRDIGSAPEFETMKPKIIEFEMRILHINLIREWFKRHLEDKPEDYRKITPYWISRLYEWSNGFKITKWQSEMLLPEFRAANIRPNVRPIKFDVCQARNGYSATAPMWRKTHNETTIGIGNPVWGAPSHPVFIIKLGEILETKNCENLKN